MNRKIAFVADLHLQENSVEKKGVDTIQNWNKIYEDLVARNIDKIILGGDLSEHEVLEKIFDKLGNFEVDVIPGNHDVYENLHKYFHSDKGEEIFYARTYHDFRFIFLDSLNARIDEDQLEFLKREVDHHDHPIIFIHHPVVHIETWMDYNHPLKNRDEVMEILKQSGKKITVVSGHYHLNYEAEDGNVKQYFSPASSYQINFGKEYSADTKSFGYLILDFSAKELQVEPVILQLN